MKLTTPLRQTPIYSSGWSPRGARKAWERISVTLDSANHILRTFDIGEVKDACGWFDDDGKLRILVADTPDRRITYRRTKRHYSVEFARITPAGRSALSQED